MKSAEKCAICGEISSIYQKESGNSLCKSCFLDYIERKINKAISKYNIISPADKLCIGISGGKDSLTLLYNLYKRQSKQIGAKKISIIFVDEGIKKYREESIKNIRDFINKFEIDVDFIEMRFKDEFGLTMDEINAIILKNQLKMNACTVCGTVRRRLLNIGAKKVGATKLAIGHNLDDTIQTFLLNILRNDLGKIQMTHPFGSAKASPLSQDCEFVPRVKPLAKLSEKEITLYCYFKKIPIQSNACPYSQSFPILRRKLQEFLNSLDERSSEIKFNLLNLNQEIIEKLDLAIIPSIDLNRCKSCNNPTGIKRDICLYCELKDVFSSLKTLQ